MWENVLRHDALRPFCRALVQVGARVLNAGAAPGIALALRRVVLR
jgi:hypothetical protein